MPNYDYKCDDCGHIFEVFQSMTAERVKECPECGGNVTRLIGAGSGLIFKGSGFYITDYKNKKPAAAPTSETSKSQPAGNDKSSSSTSDSIKPAEKKKEKQ